MGVIGAVGGRQKPLVGVGGTPVVRQAQLVAMGGPAAPARPAIGPMQRALPRIGTNASAGAGALAGFAAAGLGLLKGLGNASMIQYWGRIPAEQAMPDIWKYYLQKRIDAGTLSYEDANGIFKTAVLGAQAQKFKPTGGTMSAVHKSATDFLAKAEWHYWNLREAKKAGNIPLSRQPTRQGTYRAWDTAQKRMRETNWWEYKDQDGNDKIVVEHDDGSWHVGTPKPDSQHRTGEGPPKYFDN